jgi:hypothetical protein
VSIYLAEHEVGVDPQLIGFPNLGACMAIVVLTDRGLFGYHLMPGFTRKASIFKTFIDGRVPVPNLLRLYGSAYFSNRYDGVVNGKGPKDQWKDEMSEIATAIGFHGKVTGFDTSASSVHSDRTMRITTFGKSHIGSNYVEYRKDPGGGKCRAYYKKMSKMTTVTGLYTPGDPVQRILGAGLTAPDKNTLTLHAGVVATAGNHGELHEAGMYGKHTFTIP